VINHQHSTSFEDVSTSSTLNLSSEKLVPGTSAFWFNIGMAVVCTFFAGLMSGLTVGYLSIDSLDLELKLKGNNKEQ
jgi:hypothetical protein